MIGYRGVAAAPEESARKGFRSTIKMATVPMDDWRSVTSYFEAMNNRRRGASYRRQDIKFVLDRGFIVRINRVSLYFAEDFVVEFRFLFPNGQMKQLLI